MKSQCPKHEFRNCIFCTLEHCKPNFWKTNFCVQEQFPTEPVGGLPRFFDTTNFCVWGISPVKIAKIHQQMARHGAVSFCRFQMVTLYVYYGSGYRPAAMSAKIVSLKNNRFVSRTPLGKWAIVAGSSLLSKIQWTKKIIKKCFDLILTIAKLWKLKTRPEGRAFES